MTSFKDRLKPKDQPRSREAIQAEYNIASAKLGDFANQLRKIPLHIKEIEKIQDALEEEMAVANKLAQEEAQSQTPPETPLAVVPNEPEPTPAA